MWIDELTPCLVDRQTGRTVETSCEQIGIDEIRRIEKDFNWENSDRGFDWIEQWHKRTRNSEFYKLTLKGRKRAEGITEIRIEDGWVEGVLMEAAPHNIGRKGKYKGVGGHLTAIAVKRSLESGFEGIVDFRAKTKLIDHYRKELRAEQISGTNKMIIRKKAARWLYQKYFGEEDNE